MLLLADQMLVVCPQRVALAQSLLQDPCLGRQLLNFLHRAELQFLAKLREVFDSLFVFIPLPKQLRLVSLNLMFVILNLQAHLLELSKPLLLTSLVVIPLVADGFGLGKSQRLVKTKALSSDFDSGLSPR